MPDGEHAPPPELIVGLGNPGAEYRDTRHNAGFWFAEALARKFGGSLENKTRFCGRLGSITIGARRLRLLLPGTWMNLSGDSVVAAAAFYRIPARAILVAHDEIDLAPGTVRLKRGGGVAGHNGLRHIVQRIGGAGGNAHARDFRRLRIGVGHPGNKDEVVSYVLHAPDAAERTLIEGAIAAAVDCMDAIAAGDCEGAMRKLHGAGRGV